jgi:hypothetical protein
VGSESSLPSTLGNANTRDFAWSVGVRYRLTIRADEQPGYWVGRSPT